MAIIWNVLNYFFTIYFSLLIATPENQLIGEVQRIIADEARKGAANQFFLTPEEVTDTGIVMAERDDMKSNMINLNNGVLDL